MKKVLIFSLFVAILSSSVACKKDVDEDKLITDYLTSKGLTAEKTTEGLYYIIETQGTGSTNTPTPSNTVTMRYKGYLLDGTVFDQNQTTAGFTSPLYGLIKGWQIGVPKFKKGGKGKLFIPSSLAYGSSGSGTIPGNTPIAFDIELVDFK
ncbi:MAG: FKBP-type peptidyl-prolyl cis-trans isomerase [Saprospiraceae bacterium]|nr:FKBP-type peptidyl-prolyl cis-trans isomerase [Saprospiraceae bacterium]